MAAGQAPPVAERLDHVQTAAPHPRIPSSIRLIAAAVTVLILSVAGIVTEIHGEHGQAAALGRPYATIPYINDSDWLLTTGRDAVQATSYEQRVTEGGGVSAYPAITSMQYLPLAALPGAVAWAFTLLLAVVLMGLVVRWWLGAEAPLALQWALLGSIAVVSLVRIDQVNSAVGLAAMTAAIAAQRRGRWLLCGVALGFGLCRPTNGLPLLIAILVSMRRRPRVLVRLAAGVALPLCPFGILASIWDPSWIAHFLAVQPIFPQEGMPAVMKAMLGPSGPVVAVGLVCAGAALIAWHSADGLSLDRAAAVIALTLLCTHVGGPYVGAFVLPAAARVAIGPWSTRLPVATLALYGAVAVATNLLGLTHSSLVYLEIFTPCVAAVILLWPLLRPAHARSVPPQRVAA